LARRQDRGDPNSVIPTGAERSEAKWRDLFSEASATKRGPSASLR
jgi:hypothetical protein